MAASHENARSALADRVVFAESGCWLWQGALQRGYGRLNINGVVQYAHRHAYTLGVGPIPDGLQIDHLCRVRNCVNPEHLEAVTQRVNVLRGVSLPAQNAVKDHCKRGHPFDEKNTIRRMRHGRPIRFCRECKRLHRQLPASRAKRNAGLRAKYVPKTPE